MRKFIIMLLPALFINCGQNKGVFAFFPADESALTQMQKTYYHPPQFIRFQPPILFPENRTVWVAYNPGVINYKTPYAISLSQKSIGWIEMNLKNQLLPAGSKYLVNQYTNLSAGKYLLRVAHNNKIIGSVSFEVITDDKRNEDYIDYDAPIDVVFDTEADDIRVLSR